MKDLEKESKERVSPFVESEAEIRERHRNQRREDWVNFKGAATGVPLKFLNARLTDMEDPQRYVEILTAKDWVYTYGPVGTGKSHLLAAFTYSAFIWGLQSKYVYVPKLIKRLKAAIASRDERVEDILYYLETAGFLALDDIGTEQATDFTVSTLTSLVNERYETGRVTVVSANFDLDTLAQKYERIASRLREYSVRIPLFETRPEREG